MTLTAFCLEWHVKHSTAFHDLLIAPLKPYADIELVAWDSYALNAEQVKRITTPVIFCQFAPPPALLHDLSQRIIWIPMWDMIRYKPQRWWNKFPKNLRVVAFSEHVARRAQIAGLNVLRLQYFKDPQDFHPVTWDEGRVLMYWNRTGLISPQTLQKICETLSVQRVLFRGKIDEGVHPGAAYHLPEKWGAIDVTHIPDQVTWATYKSYLAQANIFVAPRSIEGAGMTYLEAMASGCAVLSYDGPTMNEYIQHGDNGFLFKPKSKIGQYRRWAMRRVRQRWIDKGLPDIFHFSYELSDAQDWDALKQYDMRTLGDNARQRCLLGYQQWLDSIETYAQFILDW
jgi:hypothetical protein